MTVDDVPRVAAFYLKEHGLEQRGWKFAWDNAKRRAGCCKYGSKTITISRHYAALNIAARLDDIVDTILHEVAHALCPGHMHDDVWKAKCVEIGARPVRCYDSSVVEMPKGKYAACCGGCRREYRRHKQVGKFRWRYCVACGPDKGRLDFRCEGVAKYANPVSEDDALPPVQL